MFLFDNLRDLDMRNLGIVLRGVDAAQLALALKGADEAMTDLCLSTMSQRAGETIRDEMSEMAMVKRSDVDEAQKAIMQVVRQMAANADIVIAGGADDYGCPTRRQPVFPDRPARRHGRPRAVSAPPLLGPGPPPRSPPAT